MRKCRVIFATEDDPCDLVSQQNLNRELFFLCRYKILRNEIEPVFSSTSDFNANQIQVISLSPEQKSPTKLKRPEHLIERSSLNSRRRISYSDSKNYKLGKENSPKESSKKIERNGLLSPYQKNSVKRNLNDSFADIPDSQSNTPVANYSIIDESIDSDKPLKIKLRVSQKKSPCVIVNKLDDNVLSACLEKLEFFDKKEQKLQETPTFGAVRRSTRAVQRKSYVELISPEKFTPKKRGRNKSTESIAECKATPENVEILEKTPRGRRMSTKPKRYDPNEFLTDCKTPPKKNKQDVVVKTTPNKRAAKSPDKSTDDCSTSPRKLRRTSVLPRDVPTRKSILKLTSDCNTPSKKVTLVENTASTKTPSRSTRNATPKSSQKNTPSSRAKLIRDGIISPSVQKRDKALKKGDTPLSKACGQLHVSYVPDALPCREREYADILNFLQGKLYDGCGG